MMTLREEDIIYLKKRFELALKRGDITIKQYEEVINQINYISRHKKENESDKVLSGVNKLIKESKKMNYFSAQNNDEKPEKPQPSFV